MLIKIGNNFVFFFSNMTKNKGTLFLDILVNIKCIVSLHISQVLFRLALFCILIYIHQFTRGFLSVSFDLRLVVFSILICYVHNSSRLVSLHTIDSECKDIFMQAVNILRERKALFNIHFKYVILSAVVSVYIFLLLFSLCRCDTSAR